jgi:hypothetical protein
MAIYTELTDEHFPSIHVTNYGTYAYISPVKNGDKGKVFSSWLYDPNRESARLVATSDTPEDAFVAARTALIKRAEEEGIDPHQGN